MDSRQCLCPANVNPLPSLVRRHQSDLAAFTGGQMRLPMVEPILAKHIVQTVTFSTERPQVRSFSCMSTSFFPAHIVVEDTSLAVSNVAGENLENKLETFETFEETAFEKACCEAGVGNGPSEHVDETNSANSDALVPGAIRTGRVINVKQFGAFVRLGPDTVGLIHISMLNEDSFTQNVTDVVHVGQIVKVKILSADLSTKHFRLKLVTEPKNDIDEPEALQDVKSHEQGGPSFQLSQMSRVDPHDLKVGAVFTGKVIRLEKYGAFVDIGSSLCGLIHRTNLGGNFVQSVENVVEVGEEVNVKVLWANIPLKRIALKLISKPDLLEDGHVMHGVQQVDSEIHKEVNAKDVEQSVLDQEDVRKSSERTEQPQVITYNDLKPGAVIPGKVTRIERYGAFVSLGGPISGLIHVSNLGNGYKGTVEEVVQPGQKVEVEVLWSDAHMKRASLKLCSESGCLKEEQHICDVSQQVDAMEKAGHIIDPHLREYKVSLEALQPGAVLTGKITDVQSSEAYIDVGASLPGLLHKRDVRTLYVRDMRNAFHVGKEVTVEVLHVSAKRITLSLKSENVRSEKREILKGIVKKVMPAGFVVELSCGGEGFLPTSEVLSGSTIIPESYFKVNQEIPVRILHTQRNKITLTMKKKADVNRNSSSFFNKDTERATSPFEIAFRKNAEMARYLDERQRLQNITDAKTDNDVNDAVIQESVSALMVDSLDMDTCL